MFVLICWAVIVSTLLLLLLYFTVGLRMSPQEEILGPDYVEHGLIHDGNAELFKVIQQKITKVSSGMSESQASTEASARFGSTRQTKQRLTPEVHSPDIWNRTREATSLRRSSQLHRRLYNYQPKSNSMFSLKSILSINQKNNAVHNYPDTVWSISNEPSSSGHLRPTQLQKFIIKSGQMTNTKNS